MFYIYLVCSEFGGKKLHKIGFTRRTPEIRIKEFKTGNASEIYLVESFQSKWGTKIEAQLHRFYKHKKVEGEWFDLDDNDVDGFLEKCQNMDRNLNIVAENNTYFLDKGDF
jgi:hypothetical protein